MDYDQLLEARDYIQSQTSVKPEFGVICGSGLGGLAEQLDAEPAPRVISYSDIPHFPAVSGVQRCTRGACSRSETEIFFAQLRDMQGIWYSAASQASLQSACKAGFTATRATLCSK